MTHETATERLLQKIQAIPEDRVILGVIIESLAIGIETYRQGANLTEKDRITQTVEKFAEKILEFGDSVNFKIYP